AEGERAAAGLDQEAVAMAVVAALELDDPRAPGGAAREPDGGERGLGARIHHAHHLHGRHQPRDRLGHLHFQRVGYAEAEPVAGHALHGVEHRRVVVAGDHRALGTDVVDVAVAIHVEQERPLRPLREERLAADRAERAYRRVHPSGHQRLGAFEQGMRAWGVHGASSVWSVQRLNWAWMARAAATGSGASNTPPITATRSAPASIASRAFSAVMPPMATSGSPCTRAACRCSGVARRAPGLVPEANSAPKAR